MKPLIPAARIPTPFPGFDRIIHGGDYNPDQWMHAYPNVLDEDAALMQAAGINSATIGVFSWAGLEPEKGRFHFDWLDRVMQQQATLGNKVVLATPSGAMPAWLSEQYPEVRRVNRQDLRNLFGDRHNHCWTSPAFRDHVQIINEKLAERYKDHPALGMWHVSNELNGHCYCKLCRAEWAKWLERRFGTIDKLNDAYWTGFWSRGVTRFDQVEPTDTAPDAITLEFLRFSNDQLIDYYNFEAAILRRITPNVPITTNFMGTCYPLNYQLIGQSVDVVADDQYPSYDPDSPTLHMSAARVSFKHDLYRNFRPRGVERTPFIMESCPGSQQWSPPMKIKRPGVHRLEMLQAIAHGCDGTSYFQFRAGRGGFEKLHGAVVEQAKSLATHASESLRPNRIFDSVKDLSASYARFGSAFTGTTVRPEVAFVYDWESKWAQKHTSGIDASEAHYDNVATEHYYTFWQAGIPVDVIPPDRDFSPYKLLVLPQLWIITPALATRLRNFVDKGGTLVATWDTGMTDEFNRLHLGGYPGCGLTDVFGLWVEETDRLKWGTSRAVAAVPNAPMHLPESMPAQDVAAQCHLTTATALATFAEDFYAGRPALTHNAFGRGHAFYIATRFGTEALAAIYHDIAKRLNLHCIIDAPLPPGVTAQLRGAGDEAFVFLLNFSKKPHEVPLGTRTLTCLDSNTPHKTALTLPPFASRVYRLS